MKSINKIHELSLAVSSKLQSVCYREMIIM